MIYIARSLEDQQQLLKEARIRAKEFGFRTVAKRLHKLADDVERSIEHEQYSAAIHTIMWGLANLDLSTMHNLAQEVAEHETAVLTRQQLVNPDAITEG
jgi:predicted transcriptional regulator